MHLNTIFILLLYNAVAYFQPSFKILAAEAKLMYEPRENPEIVVMNYTNFNTELIQHDHPFAHIKLIEYGVPYCGICVKFKHTFIQLSKDIFTWRNVIRPAAIDVAVTNNAPIATAWSIEFVPLLRIHPPPSQPLATKLSKQLTTWGSTFSNTLDFQLAMYKEYNASNLMTKTLDVVKYSTDPKRGSVSEKVALFKRDLLYYIEDFVRLHPDDIPETWPNLRPVTERTLADLRRHHPRQELFLIIEGGNKNESTTPSHGLRIMMELSSSSAWKAVRYVHASENRELIEDVILQTASNQNTAVNQQAVLVQNFLANSSSNIRDILLVHIDDSHSPFGQDSSVPSTKFPDLTVVSGSDLIITDINSDEGKVRATRSLSHTVRRHAAEASPATADEDPGGLDIKRKLRLVAQYINQTYIETKEDQQFLQALHSYDEHPTDSNLKQEAVQKYQATRNENQISLSHAIEKQKQHDEERQNKNTTSLKHVLNWLNPTSRSSFLSSVHMTCQTDDYDDKLKAIRYIFFQEVPRATLADRGVPEQIERLNTLVNLASVIKAYFPLPDLASVQFIDAIHSYLSVHRAALIASLSNQDRVTSNFELRSLKQVIKNLEAEGKRLPEIRNWKHCKHGGYPCALWRLFHTLTAFEYKKLSQINQLPASRQLPTGPTLSQTQASNVSSSPEQAMPTETQPLAAEQQPQAQILDATPAPSSEQQLNAGPPSPVERLVSPPSTSASLSLTIATPTSQGQQQQQQQQFSNNQNSLKQRESEIAELPMPVLLVMRDYITQYFSCEECAKNFQLEAADLSFERIRQQEPAEFSMLWLWGTHNRISKRLSINPETNPPEHPKVWYPTYEQCSKCYKKPPSYLNDKTVELAAIFHESIEWNKYDEILNFLLQEFTRQPMDMGTNIFGYTVPHGFNYIIVIGLCSLFLIVLLRCASCYIERQRRHKASLLNGNGAHYSVELQNC